MRYMAGLILSLTLGPVAHSQEAAGPCRHIDHADARYTVCSFDPATHRIALYHSDGVTGEPYGAFSALSSALWRQHRFLVFAMNGGMYNWDRSPVGLYVEQALQHVPVNTRDGWGNFHLKPNGIFYIEGHRAGVSETADFLARKIVPDYATQSGPMLVIDGKLHPRFLADSDSYKRRNGVGVSADGVVHFAISDDPVRFYDFATLFRDELKTPNALYLDGTISSAFIPQMGRRDDLFPMGPIIAVTDQVPDL